MRRLDWLRRSEAKLIQGSWVNEFGSTRCFLVGLATLPHRPGADVLRVSNDRTRWVWKRTEEFYARYHDGGLADYILAPHWLIDVLPDNVSFDVAAKVHDLANAVPALKLTALPLGGTLVITAATGTMGTATIKLASFFGAGRLILVGRSAERLEAVRPLAGSLPVETVAWRTLAPIGLQRRSHPTDTGDRPRRRGRGYRLHP